MAGAQRRETMSARHVGIIATCCLTCGIPAAMILSTAGLFYPIIASDLGVPTAQISAWMSVSMLTSAVFSPFVGSLVSRYNVRNFMVLGIVLCGVAFLIFSRGTEPWMFWLAGGITGFSLVTCLSLLPTVLVNRWFGKHVGLIIGICTSFTGIGGVVFLALGQGIIDEFGWRAAYLAFAIIAMAVCIPAVLLCVHDWPADCGMRKYGEPAPEPLAASMGEGRPAVHVTAVTAAAAEVEPQEGSPGLAAQPAPPGAGAPAAYPRSTRNRRKLPSHARSAKPARWREWVRARQTPAIIVRAAAFIRAHTPRGRAASPRKHAGAHGTARRQMATPTFWLLVASGFSMNLVCQVNGYFPMYVDWLDAQAAYGAMAGSFTTGAVLLGLSQVGNAAGKVGLGAAVDISPGKALALLGACAALGVACVWLAPATPLMAVGGLVFGFFIAGGIVLLPMLVRTVFGSGDDYPLLLSWISVAPTAGGAVGNVLFPTIAEGAGGFGALFAVVLAFAAASILAGFAALAARNARNTGWDAAAQAYVSSESID